VGGGGVGGGAPPPPGAATRHEEADEGAAFRRADARREIKGVTSARDSAAIGAIRSLTRALLWQAIAGTQGG